MHISLDGFVAGPKGELNWAKVDGEIFDFVGKRISQTDTAMYGRVTYELMESYWPTAGAKPNATQHDIDHSKWYAKAGKIVLSKTMKGMSLPNTKIISENLSDQVHDIKQSQTGGSDDILLFGSPTATHVLLEQNLIDGFWLFVNPIVLGKGISLFKDIKERIKLKQLSTHQFDCGVTELNYVVER